MTTSPTSPRTSRLVPVCGEQTTLQREFVSRSAMLAGACGSRTEDVEVRPRCTLQAHTDGEHHAFVIQLDGMDARAVWATWAGGHPPTLEVRADCEAVGPPERGSQPCCEFDGHPGAHTYDTDDPCTTHVHYG